MWPSIAVTLNGLTRHQRPGNQLANANWSAPFAEGERTSKEDQPIGKALLHGVPPG
jgi:hypothetical protein